MNGFVIVDKPVGITSSACVYKLRKIITDKKIGHCGTLDPLASGVLPISIGEATKFSSYISDLSKEYKVKVLFGVKTTTGDIEGEVIRRNKVTFTKKELRVLKLERYKSLGLFSSILATLSLKILPKFLIKLCFLDG